jgi:hypothetical protein
MALITIKDLPQGVELDRTAMQAITGGARARGRQPYAESTTVRNVRVVDYPPGFVRDVATNRQRSTK